MTNNNYTLNINLKLTEERLFDLFNVIIINNRCNSCNYTSTSVKYLKVHDMILDELQI